MLGKRGGATPTPSLRLLNDEDAAELAAERDGQLLAVARRLAERPELGVNKVVVSGLCDTYTVESPPRPAATVAQSPRRVGQVVGTLRRRVVNRSTAST